MRQPTGAAIMVLATWMVSACAAGAATPSTGVTQAPLPTSVEPAQTPAAAATASSTGDPPVIGTATLTTEGCAFAVAPGATADGPAGTGFAITVVNESPDPAGFDLWLLHQDTTYDDWVAMADQTQARFDAGGDPGSHYDTEQSADPIDLREAVDPAGSGTLVADTSTAGTYALQCWRFPATAPIRVMAAGPVTVSP